jgi:hypothetical protein
MRAGSKARSKVGWKVGLLVVLKAFLLGGRKVDY